MRYYSFPELSNNEIERIINNNLITYESELSSTRKELVSSSIREFSKFIKFPIQFRNERERLISEV